MKNLPGEEKLGEGRKQQKASYVFVSQQMKAEAMLYSFFWVLTMVGFPFYRQIFLGQNIKLFNYWNYTYHKYFIFIFIFIYKKGSILNN